MVALPTAPQAASGAEVMQQPTAPREATEAPLATGRDVGTAGGDGGFRNGSGLILGAKGFKQATGDVITPPTAPPIAAGVEVVALSAAPRVAPGMEVISSPRAPRIALAVEVIAPTPPPPDKVMAPTTPLETLEDVVETSASCGDSAGAAGAVGPKPAPVDGADAERGLNASECAGPVPASPWPSCQGGPPSRRPLAFTTTSAGYRSALAKVVAQSLSRTSPSPVRPQRASSGHRPPQRGGRLALDTKTSSGYRWALAQAVAAMGSPAVSTRASSGYHTPKEPSEQSFMSRD